MLAIDALSVGRRYFSQSLPDIVRERFLGRTASKVPRLTRRQREIVKLIADGKTNREIADALNISNKTVETHRCAVMVKLELHTSASLVRYAIRNGIVLA